MCSCPRLTELSKFTKLVGFVEIQNKNEKTIKKINNKHKKVNMFDERIKKRVDLTISIKPLLN